MEITAVVSQPIAHATLTAFCIVNRGAPAVNPELLSLPVVLTYIVRFSGTEPTDDVITHALTANPVIEAGAYFKLTCTPSKDSR